MININFDLQKAELDNSKPNIANISGIISTDEIDLQGERIEQDGLDFDYFLRKGYFNYEHKSGVENLLGYPTKVKKKGNGTEVQGVLLLDRPKAKEIYETARAMKKAGNMRTLGFSIEGQVLERDEINPKKVTKARVINCAITSNPINPNTSLALLKSILKKNVGYQTPSDTGQGISSLVPQQLDAKISNADSNITNFLNDKNLASIIKALYKMFPDLDRKTLLKSSIKFLKEMRRV